MFRNINIDFFMQDVYEEGKSRSQDKGEHGEDEGESTKEEGENMRGEGDNRRGREHSVLANFTHSHLFFNKTYKLIA